MSEILLVNPRRRRRRKTTTRKRTTRARRRNPVHRRRSPVRRRKTSVRRRRRRNPAFNVRGIQGQVMTALQGASGALALDVTLGYLPIPANLKAGFVGTGVKALLAIGIGVVGAKTNIVSNATAAKLSNGALTVVLHDELKKQLANFMPNIQMGEYLDANDLGYYGSGYNPTGMYLPNLTQDDMGFEQTGLDGMGEYLDQFDINEAGY